MTHPKSFTPELIDSFYTEASRIIEESHLHKTMKYKLRLYVDVLIGLSCKESYSYESKKYHRRIFVRTGEVRLPYSTLSEKMQISEPTAVRFTRTLESLGIISRRKERLFEDRGWQSPETTKQLLTFHGFKVLTMNFDLLESYYTRTYNIDSELERINQQPEFVPLEPTDIDQLISDQSEYSIHVESEAFQNETDEEISDKHSTLVLSHAHVVLDGSDADCNLECGIGDTAYQNSFGEIATLPEPVSVTPPPDDDWNVLVCDGGVNRDRESKRFSDLPAKPKGEYYATWLGERAGLYYAPWIVWDLDCKDSLETARDWTVTLVNKLMAAGCPESAIRVVFSTNKGFHVYLDSRTVGLKPDKALHMQLREFCLKVSPECDKSLYSMNRVIGLPNSKHRATGLRYALVPMEMLPRNLATLACLAGYQHDLPERGEQLPVPKLAAAWQSVVSKAREVRTNKFPSYGEMQRIAHDPLPEFHGVGQGERDAACWRMANYYKRMGLTEPETNDIMLAINKRNSPPLPEQDVEDKVKRVYQIHTSVEFSR